MNNFERSKQLKEDMKSFKKNPTTKGDDFDVTHQLKIDIDFLNQLSNVVDDINKEFPLAKLTIDMIEGYNGKDFLIENKKMNLAGLKEYAKQLDEKNKAELFRSIDRAKEEEEDEKDWKRQHPFD